VGLPGILGNSGGLDLIRRNGPSIAGVVRSQGIYLAIDDPFQHGGKSGVLIQPAQIIPSQSPEGELLPPFRQHQGKGLIRGG